MPKTPKQHGREGNTLPSPKSQHPLILVLLGLLVVLPLLSWIVASKVDVQHVSGREPKIYHGNPGPWGPIEYIPISIELPDHFVNVEEPPPAKWQFKTYSRNRVVELLKSSGLTPKQIDPLLRGTNCQENADGCTLFPSDDLLWHLKPTSRARIYTALAEFEDNIDQHYAFAYRPERLSERLENSGLHDSTLQMFRQLLYPQDSLLRFADTDIVLRKVGDAGERLRFVKTVARRNTFLVKLCLDPHSDVDALLNYWGIGGRAKDLRPLLESVARVLDGCKLDIAHLLPPFARQRIYTYPTPGDDGEEPQAKQDCHWTSLNFFNEHPTEGFTGPAEVEALIHRDYMQAGEGTSQARFGDVLFLRNSKDIMVHSAVYIADDIVFTKNGAGANQPWIYMRIEDMLPYYQTTAETLRIMVYRRNPMPE